MVVVIVVIVVVVANWNIAGIHHIAENTRREKWERYATAQCLRTLCDTPDLLVKRLATPIIIPI